MSSCSEISRIHVCVLHILTIDLGLDCEGLGLGRGFHGLDLGLVTSGLGNSTAQDTLSDLRTMQLLTEETTRVN